VVREERGFERLKPLSAAAEGPDPTRAKRHVLSGAISEEVPELESREVGGVLDLGFDVLRGRFTQLVLIAAVLWVPVRVISVLLNRGWTNPEKLERGFDMPVLFEFLLGFSTELLVNMSGQLLVTGSTALIVMRYLQHESASFGDTLAAALKRLPLFLVVVLLLLMASFAGFLLCLLPYFVVRWFWCLAPIVAVIERRSVADCFRRSFTLTWPSLGRWLAISIISYFMLMFFNSVTLVFQHPNVRPVMLESTGLDENVFDLIGVLVTSLFTGVASVIDACLLTAFYLDCRVRREGLDLRQRLAQLRASHAPSLAEQGAGA
jgi:hypothetical protein